MPMLLQICVVIVTMALVAIAIVTVRAMTRFEKAAAEFSETAKSIRSSIAQVENVTHEISGLVDSLGEVVPRVHGIVARFEVLGERTAQLSSAVLQEVEAPVRTAVAVARGVRRGTSFLLDKITQRFAHNSQMNGGM